MERVKVDLIQRLKFYSNITSGTENSNMLIIRENKGTGNINANISQHLAKLEKKNEDLKINTLREHVQQTRKNSPGKLASNTHQKLTNSMSTQEASVWAGRNTIRPNKQWLQEDISNN
ncbi:9665_t:CDS:1 [Dentiscutata heterogama]|uniref:9665_t:CDS:1 n=1 Tax=Dentiscutata heterogama TaxID=1316150 RepID=A0ACA9MB79_9GLOM|nr:9665_t:CDS:1 [Dentiscutata heterogama]